MSRRGGTALNAAIEVAMPQPGEEEAEALSPLYPTSEDEEAEEDVVMDEGGVEEVVGDQGADDQEEMGEDQEVEEDQEEEAGEGVPPITITRDSEGVASLASEGAELWIGAIFYVRVDGRTDALRIRSKGKLKESGFNRQEYQEMPLVIDGDDVSPLAATMRFEELSEKRSVNTATKYGMDDCARGAKRLWAQYCHTEKGAELWGQRKQTGRTDLL
jgi:hypothetical protein